MNAFRVQREWAFLLILVCPVLLAQNIELDAVLGYEGLVRGGRWNPVTVSLRNRGEAMTGTLVLTTYSGLTAESASYRLRIPLTLERGERRRIRAVVPIERTVLPVRIAVETDLPVERAVTARALPDDEPFVVALLDAGDELPPALRTATTVFPPPERLPEREIGYDPVDIIVADEASFAFLNAAQRTAIIDWIDRGGELSFAGSADALLAALPGLLDLDSTAGGGIYLDGAGTLPRSLRDGVPVRSERHGFTEEAHGEIVAEELFRFPSRATTALLLGAFLLLLAVTERYGGSIHLTIGVSLAAAVALFAVASVAIAPPTSGMVEYQTVTVGAGRAAGPIRRELVLLAARPLTAEVLIPGDWALLPPRSADLEVSRVAAGVLFSATLAEWEGAYLDLIGWGRVPVEVRCEYEGERTHLVVANSSDTPFEPVVYFDTRGAVVLGSVAARGTSAWDLAPGARSDDGALSAHQRRYIAEARRDLAAAAREGGAAGAGLVLWCAPLSPPVEVEPSPERRAVRSRITVLLEPREVRR